MPSLNPDHPLFDLQTLDAVLRGPALIEADVEDEATARALREALELSLGPLPQAELLVDASNRILSLSVPMPTLPMEQALLASRALSERTHHFRIVHQDPPGLLRARRQGRVIEERLVSQGLSAVRRTLPDRDRVARRQVSLIRPSDADVSELVSQLRAALEVSCGPGTLPEDGAMITVGRHDGALGLRLSLLPVDRQRAWDAVAAVIAARAGHRRVRLSPQAAWQERLGLELDLGLLIAPVRPLPVGDPGPWNSPLDPGPLCLELELQTESDDPPEPTDARPEELRYLSTPSGSRWVQTWRMGSPGRSPGRVVPALPVGLEELADDLTLYPHRAPQRWFVRVHDDISDTDLVEITRRRPPTTADRVLLAELTTALAAVSAQPHPEHEDAWAETVADTTSRPGLLCRLDGRHAADEPTYQSVLGALGSVAGFEAWATVAFTRNELRILLWYPTPGREDAPRSWEPA